MSDETVCQHCGRANGWHTWSCASLESWFSLQDHQRPLLILTHEEDRESVKVIATGVLATLPEVE